MADKTFKLKVIAPERVFYDGDVSFAEFCTTEGKIGIYPEHISLTTILVPGIMNIKTSEGVKSAALHSGFMEILKDQVNVLAESAEWPEEIDINRANEAKIRAERRLDGEATSTDSVKRAELALKRSLTRIELINEGSRK